LGEYPVLPHQKPRRRPQGSKPDPNPRHLVHGLERFPDDSTLQLGRIVAWTWGRDQEPMRNLRSDSEGPWQALQAVGRAGPTQREAVTALEALVTDPRVGAEAQMRIAQLQLSMGNAAAALVAANRASSPSEAIEVSYVARLIAGRALELLNRASEAAAEYGAARDLIPDAESATIALASLQFVRDDRERAVETVAWVFGTRKVTVDPGRLVGYGSFMHWHQLRAELRAALPR
jgi:hypothetical protein